MHYIGAHVSISGGLAEAPARATELGANALGMFTKNQRQWKSKELTPDEIESFHAALAASGIRSEHVIVHDSYLINIANPDAEKRDKSVDSLIDEARRVEALGLRYLNFHPGSGLGEIDEATTIALVAEGMNRVIAETDSSVLLIESTAGQGAHIGHRIEHLSSIIDLVTDDSRVGVCLDTCHLFAAGYDLRSAETFGATFDEFARVVGFDRLKAMHVNDAKVGLGSRKDRHDSIGEGSLGWSAFKLLMTDTRFNDVAMILETPDPERWKEEIRTLASLANG